METLSPSLQKKSLITESLCILTIPSVARLTVDDYFESKQETVYKAFSKKIEFDVFKKFANNFIYICLYTDSGLRFTTVPSVMTTEFDLYSMYYTKGSEKDEILQVKGKLEAIKVRLI